MPMEITAQRIVADEVRAEMGRRCMSQTMLAAALGLTQPAISRRLKGEVPFTVTELDAAATALDVPVSKFVAVLDAPPAPSRRGAA